MTAYAADSLARRRAALDSGHPDPADELHSYPLTTKFGNPARDQVVKVYANGAEVFESYGTIVAARIPGFGFHLTPAWDYSQTTNYYRGKFTGTGKAETAAAIQRGDVRVMGDAALLQWATTA